MTRRAAVLAALVCAPSGWAGEVSVSTAAARGSERYKQEGPVVNNVASFIGVLTVIPAAAISAAACPAMAMPHKKGPDAQAAYGARYKDCVAKGTAGGSSLLYQAGGFPFFIMKRVFWDAPRRLLFGPRAAKPVPAASGPDGK